MEPDNFMRWITFFILLYLFAALQASHLGAVPNRDPANWPCIEYLPLLAVFYALYAAETSAPLCALICGVVYDLQTFEFVGISTVPLALVCLGVVKIRLSLFREHFISQALVSFLAVLAFGLLSAMTHLATGSFASGSSFVSHFGSYAGNAVYSSFVAPGIFWILFHLQGILGFSSHGPRTRLHP